MLDEDGHLVYLGRSKDIIRRGGVTIVPSEVEPVILRTLRARGGPRRAARRPARRARVRRDHPRAGASELSLEELTQFLDAEGVAKYTWPERVELFDDFPRTPSLKPVKRDIVARDRQSPSRADTCAMTPPSTTSVVPVT